jgi:hypothetical protein
MSPRPGTLRRGPTTECTLAALAADLRAIQVGMAGGRPDFARSRRPPPEMLDRWARAAALAEPAVREVAIWAIREAAHAAGIVPASVQISIWPAPTASGPTAPCRP